MGEGIIGAILGAIIGALVAGTISYLLLRVQISEARRIAQAELLLQFDARLSQYDDVHRALRPGGDWREGTPNDSQVWVQIEGYMGAFERLNALIVDGIVNKKFARSFYAYRLQNIVSNPKIRQRKLVDERSYWNDFIDVCHRLDVLIPQ